MNTRILEWCDDMAYTDTDDIDTDRCWIVIVYIIIFVMILIWLYDDNWYDIDTYSDDVNDANR